MLIIFALTGPMNAGGPQQYRGGHPQNYPQQPPQQGYPGQYQNQQPGGQVQCIQYIIQNHFLLISGYLYSFSILLKFSKIKTNIFISFEIFLNEIKMLFLILYIHTYIYSKSIF